MGIARILQRVRIPFWVILAGVLFGLGTYSIMLGVLVAKERFTLAIALIALPGIVLVITLVARYFQSFVLLLPLTGLIAPYDIASGTGSKIPVSLLLTLLLTGIWLAAMYLHGWKLAPSRLNRPFLWFALIVVFSFIWGRAWRDPGLIDWNNRFIVVQIASLLTYLMSLSACLLIGNFVTTVRQMQFIVGGFIVCGTLMVFAQYYAIYQTVLTIKGLWSLWLIAPAYALLVVQPGLRLGWRVVLALLLLWTFQQVMIRDSLWLSGWVPGLASIFVITLLHSRKAFAIMLVVGAIAGFVSVGFFEQVAQDNVEEGGTERLDIWAQNLEIVRGHWLFGTGPAGYASYYATYYAETARSTHNNFFDILAQFGVVGTAIWIWLMVASVREGWELVGRAPPGFLRTMAIIATGGWVAALGSMMLGDWLLPFAYNQTITGYKYTMFSWIFLGTLISLRRIITGLEQSTVAVEE